MMSRLGHDVPDGTSRLGHNMSHSTSAPSYDVDIHVKHFSAFDRNNLNSLYLIVTFRSSFRMEDPSY